MKYVLIIHDVENFGKWKKGFERASVIRKDAGEISYKVLVDEHDVNKVIHFSLWENHKKAKMFFESVVVQKVRDELGVRQPEFMYLNEMDSGVL